MIDKIAQEVLDLPLPQYKHVPGSNQRHDTDLLKTVARQAPPVTESSSAATNIAWRYGVRLFNEGFYWESHEVLETVWMSAPPNSRERHLLQSVIQLANARLKHLMGRQQAHTRLQQLALESARRAYPAKASERLMGIDLGQLCKLAEVELSLTKLPIRLLFC
jgi:predicted metal-dependent hydrolase